MNFNRRTILVSGAVACAAPRVWGLSRDALELAREELARLRLRRELTFAANWFHPPHNGFDRKQLLGLDRSVIDELERRTGFPCKVLFGRDPSDNALMTTTGRAEVVPFLLRSEVIQKYRLRATQDYTASYLAVWAPRSLKLRKLEELRGKLVGVFNGTSAAGSLSFAAKVIEFKLQEFENSSLGRAALQGALVAETISAAFVSSLDIGSMRLASILSGLPELDIEHKQLEGGTIVFDTVPRCFGVDPAMPNVWAMLDAFISDIKADGTLDRLSQKSIGVSLRDLQISNAAAIFGHGSGRES